MVATLNIGQYRRIEEDIKERHERSSNLCPLLRVDSDLLTSVPEGSPCLIPFLHIISQI